MDISLTKEETLLRRPLDMNTLGLQRMIDYLKYEKQRWELKNFPNSGRIVPEFQNE